MKELINLYKMQTGCIARCNDGKYIAEFVDWFYEQYSFCRKIAKKRAEKIDELQHQLNKLHDIENKQADEINRLEKIIKHLGDDHETDSQHHY